MSRKDRQDEKNEKKEKSILWEATKIALEAGVCVGVGALIGAANYFYKFAMTPKAHDPRGDEDEVFRPFVEGREWMNTHPAREDWLIRSEDGLQLHANYIPAEKADHKYAICVHGYADTSESMGYFGKIYRDRYGMNVLLPDLRGHGGSEGDYVGYGWDDHFDLISWIDEILRRDPEAVMILHGISMGAAAVLLTTGEKLPSSVRAAIEDCGYSSAMEVCKNVYNGLGDMPVPAEVMLQLVRVITRIRAGYDLKLAEPIEAVKRSETPTLFIHGELDDFVPSSMMAKLYAAAACKKDQLWVPGASHVQAALFEPDTYWDKVEAFLEETDGQLLNA